MQPPTVREVIKRLESEGWEMLRMKGDHRRFAKGDRRVTIAGKPGDHLKPKTWTRIQEQAGW